MPTIREAILLGVQHQQSRRFAEAESIYRQILAIQPDHADALHLLGSILTQCGRAHEATELIRRAIAINPHIASYHNSLGLALAGEEKLEEATASYRAALQLQPNMQATLFNLAHALINQGEVREAIACYRQLLALNPDDVDCHSNLLYALHFDPDSDAQTIAQEAAQWNQRHALPLQSEIIPHQTDRDPDRPLRIGYVSADLWGHAVGRFLLPLLENRDRAQFPVYCYADVANPDYITNRLRAACEGWRSIVGQSDQQVAEQIRADRIDILVDLAAHSGLHRLLVFARKPAPIQVTYLGYPGTTGVSTMDYRISDPYLDPIDGSPEFVEAVCRLPQSYWCYQAPLEAPEVNGLPALSSEDGVVTFGCLNKNYKVTDSALETWGRLLNEVPRSRMIFVGHAGAYHQRVIAAFRYSGIDEARIGFIRPQPLAGYLSTYHQIDLALDSFPYNGGTTTCDALWMGVPVVTLAGALPVGRAGVSILSNVGLPEFIAVDRDSYIQIAKSLAHDLQLLAQLRATLRNRILGSPLMDGQAFARNMKTIYRDIWRRFCQPPR